MRLSKVELRSYTVEGKELQTSLKRHKVAINPYTEPLNRSSQVAPALPGSLMHLSQSDDGKLRWNPPSSSSSSINDGDSFSGCFSSDSRPVSSITPGSMGAKTIPARRKVLSRNKSASARQESSVFSRESPSLTCCYQALADSNGSVVQTGVMEDDCHVHEILVGSRYQDPSSSELSISSLHVNAEEGNKKLAAAMRDSLPRGLSTFLSSKLKPGKHILGSKNNQIFIRPGQLRHWAVGNSPLLVATSLVSAPAMALKGKACRNLAF